MKRIILICILIPILIPLCKNALNSSCKENNDCEKFNQCNLKKQECVHENLYPISNITIFGMFCLFFISAIANAGGIGGGGLVVPILLIILKFYTYEAIPISKLMIFSGSLTSFFMGFKIKNPLRKGTVAIDYNIPALLCPFLLFGTMVGVAINKVVPPIVVLISLSTVLIINTFKTFKKAVSLYKKENLNKHIEEDQESEDQEDNGEDNRDSKKSKYAEILDKNYHTNFTNSSKTNNEKVEKLDVNIELSKVQPEEKAKSRKASLNDNNTNQQPNAVNSTDLQSPTVTDNKQVVTAVNRTIITNYNLLLEENIKDKRKFPIEKYMFFIFVYLVLIIFTFIKGSDHLPSIFNITPCSIPYWITFVGYIPFALICTAYSSLKIKKEYEYRKSIGYPYKKQDIKWSTKYFIKFPLYGFIAGSLAGGLGIGGGLILAPLLLEIGLHPVISSATSNFLVLFTSSSTSLQFILLGMMRADYGIICTIISVLGSFIGTFIIQRIIKKSGRYSYLIFMLAFSLLISGLVIPTEAAFSIIASLDKETDIFKIRSPC